MKKISKILGSVILSCGILFSACSDMLDVSSDRYVNTDDNDLSSPNDSVYSLWGILQQMRSLADRYVILGELRADLIDVTEYSDQNLRDINNINYSVDNPYISTKEYFSVINNCNYYLSKVDPNSTGEGSETMRLEYAAIKGIRAWTYWQLGLNYGEVPYIENPILTVEDMNKDYPMLTLDQLVDKLIQDLLPYEALRYPAYTIDGPTMGNPFVSSSSLIPIPYLLGDLYLWKEDFETAATYYHRLISGTRNPNNVRMPVKPTQFRSNRVQWNTNPALAEGNYSYMNSWTGIFSTSSSLDLDIYSILSENNNDYSVIEMANLCAPKIGTSYAEYLYALKPSQAAMDIWANEIYFYPVQNSTTEYEELLGYGGDLRGGSTNLNASYGYAIVNNDTFPYITKYTSLFNTSTPNRVFLYRYTTLYLRLAEAVNRAGKPSVALAALKYGLSNTILENPDYVNPDEVSTIPSYLDFNFIDLAEETQVIGLHARGSGAVDRDTVHYVFDETRHLTRSDSIQFVEELLLKEYALEMAFEGNRFYDLMRFAKREGNPAILTEKIRVKNPTAAAKLANEQNWYLPADFKQSVSEETENP